MGSSPMGTWDASIGDDERRRRLARFDAVLNILESAHDRGLTEMTPRMWAMITEACPGITLSWTIVDAIEEVFEAQAPLMVRPFGNVTRRRGFRESLPAGVLPAPERTPVAPLAFRHGRLPHAAD
ncbi:MAG TPA: hypothetical protein VFO60_02730 [Candidatus Dormibacteraeota bacterium]|nr:hypothetical protein [Candidatus Dormibacteraeota bacterium]